MHININSRNTISVSDKLLFISILNVFEFIQPWRYTNSIISIIYSTCNHYKESLYSFCFLY